MKILLRILAIATVIFIAVAMVQEWQVFASAWFGYQGEAPTLSPVEREETENALRHYLTLSGHLYRSNGDPRFLERMPAAPRVRDELMADIVYLRHNGRYQEPTMEGLEVEQAMLIRPNSVEIQTREYWIIRTRSLIDGMETDPVRSEVISVRYLMFKENSGWVVQMWELVRADREREVDRRLELTNENHETNAKAQRRKGLGPMTPASSPATVDSVHSRQKEKRSP